MDSSPHVLRSIPRGQAVALEGAARRLRVRRCKPMPAVTPRLPPRARLPLRAGASSPPLASQIIVCRRAGLVQVAPCVPPQLGESPLDRSPPPCRMPVARPTTTSSSSTKKPARSRASHSLMPRRPEKRLLSRFKSSSRCRVCLCLCAVAALQADALLRGLRVHGTDRP